MDELKTLLDVINESDKVMKNKLEDCRKDGNYKNNLDFRDYVEYEIDKKNNPDYNSCWNCKNHYFSEVYNNLYYSQTKLRLYFPFAKCHNGFNRMEDVQWHICDIGYCCNMYQREKK